MTVRVLHLIKSFGRGGAEMLLAEGLRFADRERFTYSFGYFLPWKDAVVPSLLEQGAEVTCFQATSNARILLSAKRVADHLRRHRIDLLHCHLPVAGAVGRIAGRLARVPVVYTEHNKQERYHLATRKLNRWTWGWQDAAIAVSDDVARSIREHIPGEVPLHVVLNGVDVDLFDRDRVDPATVRRRFGIPADSPVVGTVAVFRVQKRLEDWLEAADLLRQRIPGIRFLIVGDGPLRQDVEAEVARRGLGSTVFLPGLQEEVRPFLAAMDVYMMSSIFEGLPVALLEAMSMRCAPVCTAVGGIPELVRTGTNGVLVRPGDPASLATAVAELLEDSPHRRILAEAARETVVRGFSMGRMIGQLERIYDSVLSARGVPMASSPVSAA